MSCCAPAADLSLLDLLTTPGATNDHAKLTKYNDLDPLMLAAVVASGPHVTRNHYHHDFFPSASGLGKDITSNAPKRLTYVSRQAPRRQRLQQPSSALEAKENDSPSIPDPLRSANNLPPQAVKKRRESAASVAPPPQVESLPKPPTTSFSQAQSYSAPTAELTVKCMARTRIPTPHGPAFLHLYHNNKDAKEHLAIVIDPAQLSDSPPTSPPPIRSQSLDAVWHVNETDMERIIRGAYTGQLSPSSSIASHPPPSGVQSSSNEDIPSPLIRIHSECFTGETVGSMRCDCGEQLDQAIKLISQPIHIPSPETGASSRTIPGRGCVVYLRQEGRGIGLLSKIRAYNLQDLGHDTVTANLMLGHQPDERRYDIAAAILRDLGMALSASDGVRLLTNNPDKVQALEKAGVRIAERVPMIPRSWQCQTSPADGDATSKTVHGEDLDKYLHTKILRMGHMLPLGLDASTSKQ